MRNFSRWSVLVGVMGASLAAVSAAMVGCSGDDTVVPPDSGPDVVADTFKPDTNPPVEAGPDVLDAGSDAPADAAEILAYIKDHQTKICARYAQCCFGADASAYDPSKCQNIVGTQGWEGSLADLIPVANGGRLTLDKTAAADCANKVGAFTCPTMNNTDYNTVVASCFQAVKGTQGAGKPCNANVECQTGLYCGAGDAGDAGIGLCTPVGAQNAPCSTPNLTASLNQGCQYLGYVGSPARCDLSGGPDGSAPSKTCQARYANGVDCSYNWECASGVCDNTTYKCGNSIVVTSPFLCGYITKDGG